MLQQKDNKLQIIVFFKVLLLFILGKSFRKSTIRTQSVHLNADKTEHNFQDCHQKIVMVFSCPFDFFILEQSA